MSSEEPASEKTQQELVEEARFRVGLWLPEEGPGLAHRELECGTARLHIVYRTAINFALVHNGVGPLAGVGVLNEDPEHSVKISSITASLDSLGMERCWSAPAGLDLPPLEHQVYGASETSWPLPMDRFLNIDESSTDLLRLEIVVNGQTHAHELPVRCLAHDEWNASTVPELLAAFVQPRSRAVQTVLDSASDILERTTGDSSLAGYQKGPERVRLTTEAIYDALRLQQIRYSEPPASFEETGQRIRPYDAMLESRFGTCIDLALLFAAAAEEAGLNPVLVMQQGHAFPGVMLTDVSPSSYVVSSQTQLSNLFGGDLLLAVETTAATAPGEIEFATAVETAHRSAQRGKTVRYVLDVRAAHRRVRPLPTVTTVEGTRVLETVVTHAPAHVPGAQPSSPEQRRRAREEYPQRVRVWLSGLLDLTRRNPLLNLSPDSGVRVLVTPSQLGTMEDDLSDGRSIRLLTEDDMTAIHISRGWTSTTQLPEEERFQVYSQERALYVHSRRGRASNKLNTLRREARRTIEETGANSLFLTIGTFEWKDASGREGGSAPLYLLPVTLTGSPTRPHELRLEPGAEIRPNYSLIEKLRQDHELEFPVLEQPYQDSAGIDIPRIFTELRTGFSTRGLSFSLTEDVRLAILRFSTLDLWRDVKEHWSELSANPLVQHLIEATGELFEDSVEAPELAPEDEARACLPVPADSSQMAAVRAASAGSTFVLEGPPGTGKSQTITNMIADGLSEGRKILFVAEKQAALSVVEERLRRIGLSPLVLNVHGAKISPKDVRLQLRTSLDEPSSPPSMAFQTLRNQLDRSIQELSRYPRALHGGEHGQSVWDLFQHREQLEEKPQTHGVWQADQVHVPESQLDDAAGLAELAEQIERCERRTQGARLPRSWELVSPLAGHHRTEEAPDADAMMDALLHLARAVQREDSDLLRLLDLMEGHEDELQEWLAELQTERSWIPSQLQRAVQDPEKVTRLRLDLDQARESWRPLLDILTPAAHHADIRVLAERYREAQAAGIFKRSRLTRLAITEIQALVVPSAAEEVEGDPLRLLAQVEALRAASDALRQRLDSMLGQGSASPFDRHLPQQLWAHENHLREQLMHRHRLESLLRVSPEAEELLEQLVHSRQSIGSLGRLESAARTLWELWEALTDVLDLDEASERTWRAERPRWVAVSEDAPSWAAHAEQSQREQTTRILRLRSLLRELEARGLRDVAEQIYQGRDARGLREAVERGTARTALFEALRDSGLSDFEPADYQQRVARYLEESRDVRDGWRSELPKKLLDAKSRRETVDANLRRELGRKRGGSIRGLFETFGDQVLQITPCVLMSPASVARFLPAQGIRFDTVIFDEASQIRVADAIGALGRADSAVVVGDSQQMPPTSIFGPSSAADDDAELGAADQESILSEAVASGVEQRWLSWHYRSQDDSLISFSNRRYYRSRLAIFPAPPEHRPGYGIDVVPVGGQYDHGGTRTNPAEAEAIVAEISRHLSSDPDVSIGVITFNVQQRDLILDLLERSKHRLIQEALLRDVDPLFVKNLENVQGDERDIILFSLAFSRKADGGELPMNFGPLNNAGGERRLNVAITRARRAVRLFTSLRASELDLSRARSEGVAHLKEYLRYAEEHLQVTGHQTQESYDLYRDGVRDALQAEGLEVISGIGVSSFTVDLAVRVGPEYGWLAVLLDTPEWARRTAVSDRVALPAQVLQGVMGWQDTIQVLLPAWHQDRTAVVQQILAAAQALTLPAEDASTESDEPSSTQTEEHVDEAEVHLPPDHSLEEPGGQDTRREVASIDDAVQIRSSPFLVRDQQDGVPAIAQVSGPVADPSTDDGSAASPESAQQEPYEVALRLAPDGSLGGQEVLDHLGVPEVRQRIRAVLEEIITYEGPIEESQLARQVARRYGYGRVSAQRAHEILRCAPRKPERIRGFSSFYWPEEIDPVQYRGYRSGLGQLHWKIDQISPREQANAILATLAGYRRTGAWPPSADLVRASSRRLGFARAGAQIQAHIADVIDWMMRTGQLERTEWGGIAPISEP